MKKLLRNLVEAAYVLVAGNFPEDEVPYKEKVFAVVVFLVIGLVCMTLLIVTGA